MPRQLLDTSTTTCNTADVLRAYRAGVEKIKSGAESTKDVFEAVRAIYTDDEDFRRSFEAASFASSGPRKKLVKYLLARLESTFGATPPDFESDPATIEHILPENPSDAWDVKVDPETRDRFVYRLGNLTLLEPPLNREAANAGFSIKRAIYVRSRYVMTRSIDQEEWTVEAIRVRQADLARRAAQAWRLDF